MRGVSAFWRADPFTFGLLPNSIIYGICILIDFFFLSLSLFLLEAKMKELESLSSMSTQPTHPSSIKIPFYLAIQPGMDSVG